jgi:hypothetical protein
MVSLGVALFDYTSGIAKKIRDTFFLPTLARTMKPILITVMTVEPSAAAAAAPEMKGPQVFSALKHPAYHCISSIIFSKVARFHANAINQHSSAH